MEMVTYTKANGSTIRQKEKDSSSMRMGLSMRASSRMISKKERAKRSGLMGLFLKASMLTERKTAKENSNGPTALISVVNFVMVKFKEKGKEHLLTAINMLVPF